MERLAEVSSEQPWEWLAWRGDEQARAERLAEELVIEQLSMKGQLQDQRLTSELTLVSDLASANASLEHGLDANGPLSGQVAFQLSSLSPLALLTTDLREISGQVRGDFALAGTLRQPLMDGNIRLHNGNALVPALGVAVTDLQMDVQGSPRGQLDVNGRRPWAKAP